MIGKRITELRKQKNIKQKELADMMNVTAGAVSQWEHDITSPDIQAVLRLSEILGTSVSYLMGEEESAKPIENKQIETTTDEKTEKLLQLLAQVPENKLDQVLSILQIISKE